MRRCPCDDLVYDCKDGDTHNIVDDNDYNDDDGGDGMCACVFVLDTMVTTDACCVACCMDVGVRNTSPRQARMLVESGLTLALEHDKIKVAGGIYTPASSLVSSPLSSFRDEGDSAYGSWSSSRRRVAQCRGRAVKSASLQRLSLSQSSSASVASTCASSATRFHRRRYWHRLCHCQQYGQQQSGLGDIWVVCDDVVALMTVAPALASDDAIVRRCGVRRCRKRRL